MYKIKRRTLYYYTLLFFIMLWSIFFSDHLDYPTYKLVYENPQNNSWEIGYKFFNLLFFNAGFSFFVFRALCMFTGLTIISHILQKKSKMPIFVLSLLCIYPLLIYNIQLRSFIAMSMVFFGTQFLTGEKNKAVLYVFFVFIASLFHFSAVIYLCFLIVPYINLKKLFRFIFLITVVSIFSARFLFPYLIDVLYKITSYDRILYYETNAYRDGRIPFSLIYIPLFAGFVFYLYRTRIYKNSIINKNDENYLKISLTISFFPLLKFFSAELDRIFVMSLPLYILGCSNYLKYTSKIKIKFENNILIFYMLLLTLLVFMHGWGPQNQDMFDALKKILTTHEYGIGNV